MGSHFEDDQARILQNGPMPKKKGNMNPASKNFNKVPPKRYKAGSASNQAPTANAESQPAATSSAQDRPSATSAKDSKRGPKSDNLPLYKIKYINNTAQNSNAQVHQRAHMKPVQVK